MLQMYPGLASWAKFSRPYWTKFARPGSHTFSPWRTAFRSSVANAAAQARSRSGSDRFSSTGFQRPAGSSNLQRLKPVNAFLKIDKYFRIMRK
jgi:hypothetical protein